MSEADEIYRKWWDEQANRERFKKRSEETWGEVRRAWEAGETGASLAQRYDVGLANLWRRRASEGWARRERDDPTPEPVEGWRRFRQKALEQFERELRDARDVAQTLIKAMQGEALDDVALWHLGFVLDWRARHLGAETARRDREWASQIGWTADFWDEDGLLRPVHQLDWRTRDNNREVWRDYVGLPAAGDEEG